MHARDLLTELRRAGFGVSARAGRLVIWPASKLTEETRAALRQCRPVLLALLAPDEARRDGGAARFLDRRARLMCAGWPAPEAEAVAERLSCRDREGDSRVCCIECDHYMPGRCANYLNAKLSGPALGSCLASTLQHCLGYREHRP